MSFKVCSVNLLSSSVLAIFLLFVSPPLSVQAEEVGNVEAGKMIADSLCAGCHSMKREENSPILKAPPLRQVVQKWSPEKLAKALTKGLVAGHEAMPEFQFGPGVLADFLAYIKTLPNNDQPKEAL